MSRRKEGRAAKPPTESRKRDHQRDRGKTHTHVASVQRNCKLSEKVHKTTFRLEDINTFTMPKEQDTARSDNQQYSRAFSAPKEHHCSAVKTFCREHFPCHMKIPKSLFCNMTGSRLDLPGAWIPGASPTHVFRCCALSVSNHSTLDLS